MWKSIAVLGSSMGIIACGAFALLANRLLGLALIATGILALMALGLKAKS